MGNRVFGRLAGGVIGGSTRGSCLTLVQPVFHLLNPMTCLRVSVSVPLSLSIRFNLEF